MYLNTFRGHGLCPRKEHRNVEGEILASWVSEDLRATPDNDWIYYEHIGFSRYYANEVLFRIRDGRVLETIPYQNTFRQGDLPLRESWLRVTKSFDASKFPELKGKSLLGKNVVLYPTADGHVDSVAISYQIYDKGIYTDVSPQQARKYTEELRKHTDSLRWEVLTIRGVIKYHQPYVIRLYPSKTNR